MTAKDSTTVEGTQDSQSKGSDKPEGQQSSVATDVIVQQITKLQAQLDTLARQQQSGKDRAIKQTNSRLDALEGNLREVLQTARTQGKSVDDLLKDVDEAEERETRSLMLEMAKSFREGRFPGPAGRQPEGDKGTIASEVLSELELDASDTRVQEFRARSFASREEAYREGAKLLKKIQTVQPSDADKPGEVSGTRRPATNQEELKREYEQGSKDLYGRQLILFKQQMRQKGLDIS